MSLSRVLCQNPREHPPCLGHWTCISQALESHIGEWINGLMQHIPSSLKNAVMVLIIVFHVSFHPFEIVALFSVSCDLLEIKAAYQ